MNTKDTASMNSLLFHLKCGLEYMKTFQCEHVENPDADGSKLDCFHAYRGGVCNSCWARSWAEDISKRTEVITNGLLLMSEGKK